MTPLTEHCNRFMCHRMEALRSTQHHILLIFQAKNVQSTLHKNQSVSSQAVCITGNKEAINAGSFL